MSTTISTHNAAKGSSMTELALSYIARGWPVFPCRADEEYDYDTGEVFQAKAPYTSNGLRGATKNERIIREWWRRHPDAMVGVPTGSAIGVFVLDVDVPPKHEDGRVWLAAMEAMHGALPPTLEAETANGGRHIFFRHVDGVRNRSLGSGVETRGEGGYIVAPGSRLADGGEYRWLNDLEPADAPPWLLDLILPPPAPQERYDYHYTSGDNEPYVEAAVKHELDSLAAAAPGGRGYALNASAFALGTLVGAGALSRSEAESGLYDAARACGVLAKDGERETIAKIRRGLDAGIRQPREIPERQTARDDGTKLVDIKRMLARAKEKAGAGNPVLDDSPPHHQEEPEIIPNGAETSAEPADPPPEAPAITATPFQWRDPATLPRREFAFGTHYIRKYVSVTVSPGGLGKTSNSIVEALSMASGKPLLGVPVPQRLRVWLFNAEDPRDELERRIMAACMHYRLRPEDIDGHLFLDTGREQELVVAVEDKRAGFKYQVPIIESVIAQIRANGIDVMTVDPFVSTHGVNENDNGAIDKVAKLWAHIADDTNTAIDVVHHLRKVSDREATVEDARGAVALIGAARSVRVLNRMSEDQATAAGLATAERFSFFNINQGKQNLTPMNSSQDWRRLVSVPLGNGRGLNKPQDHAGVVTKWHWPSTEEVAEGLTEEQSASIRSMLNGASYKRAPQGRPWAGEAIAYVLGLDISDKGDKQRVSGILKALLAEGVLVEVEERDPVSRQAATFVRGA